MKLLVIYTGGTVGMVKDAKTNALVPGGVEAIQNFVVSEFKDVAIDFRETQDLIDSSNFGLAYFKELAAIIENNYTTYDAFLVLMGTDTMAYVSSLLSYCCLGLRKSIVFTGGQYPLSELNSDSKYNLKNAITRLLTNSFPLEVGVFFANQWYRAVQVTKVDTQGIEAYKVPNPSENNVDQKLSDFEISKNIEANIGVVKLVPFGNELVLTAILASNQLDGLVLEVFGAGNLPEFSTELKKLFTEKVRKGFKVVLVSQCLFGGVVLGKYGASLLAKELGFISGNTITTESAVAKMMFLHQKKLNQQQYQLFFEDSLRGE